MQMKHFLLAFLGVSTYFMYAGGGGQFGHAAHVGGSLAGLAFYAATRGRALMR